MSGQGKGLGAQLLLDERYVGLPRKSRVESEAENTGIGLWLSVAVGRMRGMVSLFPEEVKQGIFLRGK